MLVNFDIYSLEWTGNSVSPNSDADLHLTIVNNGTKSLENGVELSVSSDNNLKHSNEAWKISK